MTDVPTPGAAEVLPATREGASPALAARQLPMIARPERALQGPRTIGGYSFTQIEAIADHASRAGMFKGVNTSAAFMKIIAGLELGLPISVALSQIDVIEGNVALESNLMASLVKRHPDYRYKVVEWTDERCEIRWDERDHEAGVWLEGEAGPNTKFDLDDARRAELLDHPKKLNWKRYPKAMLFARALAQGARAYCGDALSNVYLRDELDTPAQVSDDEYAAHVEKLNRSRQQTTGDAAIVDAEIVTDKPPAGSTPAGSSPDATAQASTGEEPRPADLAAAPLPHGSSRSAAAEKSPSGGGSSPEEPQPAGSSARPAAALHDSIGRQPLDGAQSTPGMITMLRKKARPLDGDDLKAVVWWATRNDEGKLHTAMVPLLHETRCRELVAFFDRANDADRTAMIATVAEYLEDEPIPTGKPAAGDAPPEPGPAEGKLL